MFVDVIHTLEFFTYVDWPRERTDTDFQFALQFVEYVKRITALTVKFVYKYDYRCVAHTTHFHQFAGLPLHAFGYIDNDDYTVDCC